MTNVLKAIVTFTKEKNLVLPNPPGARNRMNSIGDAAETYMKDLFCDAFNLAEVDKIEKHNAELSYIGNSSNPPDFILRGGDAVEVKKIEGRRPDIALNSSFPKHRLLVSDIRITQDCRNCEDWREKDIIYSIVSVSGRNIDNICMVYGDCYCADNSIYERIINHMTEGIHKIEYIELAESTNELARLNRVDPLGITYLRVRGMWGIKHPYNVFSYIENLDENVLNVFLLKSKYDSFPEDDRKKLESIKSIHVRDIKIKNPNNPADLLDAKHIFIIK